MKDIEVLITTTKYLLSIRSLAVESLKVVKGFPTEIFSNFSP